LVVLDHTGVLDDLHIVAVLVAKLALFGFRVSLFDDAALLNICRAVFAEATATLQ
jgi:hypothetical protein